jgi:hypothetical protein
MPARAQRAQMRLEGPLQPVFGSRPGIAWGRLLRVSSLARAVQVSKRAGGQDRAIRVSTSRRTGRQTQLDPRHFRVSTPWLLQNLTCAIRVSTPRRTGRRAPRAVSGAPQCRAHPSFKPSRATSALACGAGSGSPAKRDSARQRPSLGHPASRASCPRSAERSGTDPNPSPRKENSSGQQVGIGAVEATRDSIPRPPGCSQGTSLEQVGGLAPLPSSK